jgi:hypothetical protein
MWDSTVSTPAKSATYAGSALSSGVTYRWRVRAFDNYELSSWLYGGTFKLNNPPNKPTNLSPSTRQTTTSVSISAFVTDNNGDNINVFFYEDNATHSLIDNVWIDNGGTATRTWGSLTRGTTYVFFARGQDNNGAWGENSSIQSFKVNSLPIAENQKAENRVSPDNLTTSAPLLSWNFFDNDGDNQIQRQIQVGTVENDNSMWDSTVSTPAKSATYAGSALSSGVTYRWRVRVFDNYEWSSWLYGGTFKLVRSVEVSISPENKKAPPENTLTFTVTVTNTGEAVDNFDLTITDDAEWGATLSENELLNVESGASGTVTVSVTIPSGTLENVRTVITVTATSRADSSATDSYTCRAIAGPTGQEVQVTISETSKSGAPGEDLTFTVTVTNLGSAADTFTVEVTDTENWAPTVSPDSFPIGAGASRSATLSITIPSTAADDDSTTITVTAAGTGYENSATCTATAQAADGGVSPVVYVGIVIVIVAILGALLIFIKPF